MKAVCKKLFSLMLVAILLVSAVPFQASAAEVDETVAAETEEVVATSPAADAEVVEKEARYVEFQVSVEDSDYYRVKLVKSKIGSKVSTPSESAVLSVVKSIIGSSDGYKLVRWELAEEGTTFTSSTTINLSMATGDEYPYPEDDEDAEEYIPVICVNAILEKAAKTIALKPNGGVVSTTKHTVELDQQYDYYGGLPTPTRDHYSFAGWAKEDGTIVGNEDTVTDLSALTATWTAKKYTVIYEGYTDAAGSDSSGWEEVGFGSFTVDANSVLKTAYNNFPTESQINSMFLTSEMKADGWYIDGWVIKATGATFTAGSTKITSDTVIHPVYKKSITLYADDSGKTTRSLTVTLGRYVPSLPHPGTRDGKAFIEWQDVNGDTVATKSNLSDTSAHPKYWPVMGDFTAVWDDAKTVYLYIHTDGDTKDHTKLVKYYDVPASGFDLRDIDLADIYANYGKYDDDVDEQYGWYNSTQWNNYCLGKHVNDTTEYVTADELELDDVHEFYIMLINNGAGSSSSSSSNGSTYNDNSKTVDSSNPSTGDAIFAPMAIMAVSAAALVLFFLNKKRVVK